ncbi:MAG: ribosome maturation factor RimP [Thermoleophilia bacterium]|nr:ribosome maturation factor RimP [Thermoleophilia bacterium]
MKLSEDWLQEVINREVEGVELVALDDLGNRRRRIVRLYIDHPGGVNHNLCAQVSQVVGKALDELDLIEGSYTLEVSSPGLDRPLRKRSHFEAQIGKKVYVRTGEPIAGTKVRKGVLAEVRESEIVVREAGQDFVIPLEEIVNAHLIYEFK